MKKIIKFLAAPLLFLGACTNLDQEFHDKVTPESFLKSAKDIQAVLYRPFTHVHSYLVGDRWLLQELTADQFAVTTKGRHWYEGGRYERPHYHSWTLSEGRVWETWRSTFMGIALAMDAKNDLKKLDYAKFGLTPADKEEHENQLNTIIAFFYLCGLDYFGGLPVFESLEGESLPRETDEKTFAHIESLLKAAIQKLPKKKSVDREEGAFRQGGAAALLARLYFNATAYIRKPMFEECKRLCQDILDKKYGEYSLDPTWFGPHSFNNDKSPEIIWSMPSEFNKLQYDWFYPMFYHYNTRKYFDIDGGTWNGVHLTPSRSPAGALYQYRLGSPFEKYNDADLRKKPYKYLGNGRYEGMFIVGPHLTPSGEVIKGSEEHKDQPLVFVDQVGRFSEVGPGKPYASAADLPSRISEGEENTGIRLVKTPIPNNADKSLRWGADNPAIRLTEIQYMLAECLLRTGDKGRAAALINEVRRRNFEGADPDPVTAANLDDAGYRMLDEWGIEFLGEGRRRTDLIRWDKFTTESWWAHEPSAPKYKRFPVPTQAISGNNNLKQNDGY